MIKFTNNEKLKGKFFESKEDLEIDASNLTVLPALIDPHVHFRTPGAEHKENWITASKAAISSGITTVFDMPNNDPSCTTQERLIAKKNLIDSQLKESQIPLRYHLYFGADKDHLDEIIKVKDQMVGVKVYMGSTTGSLLVETLHDLKRIFEIANEHKLILSFHAENEDLLKKEKSKYQKPRVCDHPFIRPRGAAILATSNVLEMAKDYPNVVVNILHISTKEELNLIRQARLDGVKVHAETTPNHLFLDLSGYTQYGSFMQMNPPVRESSDQNALWDAIADNTIDWIGTDHAPHTIEEKKKDYPKSPSGIPGIETLLPLLLNAVNEKRLSIDRLIELTRTNIERIFNIPSNEDLVLVDLNLEKKVLNENLFTKCGWSPYRNWTLKGWPIYTILRNKVYFCEKLKESF